MQRPVRSEDGVVTCFRDGMVTLRSNRRLDGFTESLKEIGYQGVRRGDLVIHAMDAFAGAIGVADSDGKSTPVYSVCAPRTALNVHYYANVVREMARSQWIAALAKGIRERSTDFRYEAFANEWVPFPPVEEQNAIASFIHGIDGKTKKLIRAKRRVIELLNEQKQMIIQRAVLRGIEPGVDLQDSGVEWLGRLPQHWQVLRSKYIFREVDARSTTGEETHLSMSQRLGLVRNEQIEERRLISESYVGAKLCQAGDLVLNRLKAHLGVFAIAAEPGLISPDYSVFRPIHPVTDKYFEFVLRTPACRIELRKRAKGIVQGFWRLYTDDFYDIRVPVPPLKEQKQIVLFLDAHLEDLNAKIDQIRRGIIFLGEYRTRLIADVVTGKLDVRGVELPELNNVEEVSGVEDEDLEDSEELETVEENADAD
jgi:type I restriction enzyme S subunit